MVLVQSSWAWWAFLSSLDLTDSRFPARASYGFMMIVFTFKKTLGSCMPPPYVISDWLNWLTSVFSRTFGWECSKIERERESGWLTVLLPVFPLSSTKTTTTTLHTHPVFLCDFIGRMSFSEQVTVKLSQLAIVCQLVFWMHLEMDFLLCDFLCWMLLWWWDWFFSSGMYYIWALVDG